MLDVNKAGSTKRILRSSLQNINLKVKDVLTRYSKEDILKRVVQLTGATLTHDGTSTMAFLIKVEDKNLRVQATIDAFSKYLRAHSEELPDQVTPSSLRCISSWSPNATVIFYPVFDFLICVHIFNLFPDAKKHIDTARAHAEG